MTSAWDWSGPSFSLHRGLSSHLIVTGHSMTSQVRSDVMGWLGSASGSSPLSLGASHTSPRSLGHRLFCVSVMCSRMLGFQCVLITGIVSVRLCHLLFY